MSIVVKNLWHVYSGGTPFEVAALRGVNLTINQHELVAIIGQTGSGKSTLVQHFNALLKPTRGTVIVDGIDIAAKNVSLKTVRQKVGLVFQFPEHQLFEETVFDDIAFGPRNMGLGKEAVEERVREAAAAVGLCDGLFDRSPFELSGGQKRRVAVAGVLAMRPNVLVLDEPTAGLDPRGRDEILQLIARLHSERRITVILVTHSMEDVARVAQRLIVMHRGQVVLDGSPRQVFARQTELRQFGLSVPQVTLLLSELRARGWEVPPVALSVAEAKEILLRAVRRKPHA